jgi:dTDP-glucose 4,6-dehydratase
MPSVLVTGGAGFIGANFVHFWLARHTEDTVVVLDALTYAGNLANLAPARSNPRFTFVHGDIGTPGLAETVLRDHGITTVVHFAAESHVDRSIVGPDPFLTTNVLGTHELLKAARKVWLEEGRGGTSVRFHHVSTDEVYGSLGPGDPPFSEQSPYRPNSPYAASKAAADHLVGAYSRTFGLPVTTINCSNNYGPYQLPEKLIPLAIVQALQGKPIPVYGDGLQVRDWLHVEDHCRAIELVLGSDQVGETYNVGGQAERTNVETVSLVARLLDEAFAVEPRLAQRYPRSPAAGGGTAELITHVADRPGHDRRYAMSNRKIELDLGFEPAETFENGIRNTVAWYLAREDWWREVMDGSYREWMRKQYGSVVSF